MSRPFYTEPRNDSVLQLCISVSLGIARPTDIDTASVYNNETEVAEGIRASGVARSDIWITSKLQPRDQGDKAYDACLETLRRLNTD